MIAFAEWLTDDRLLRLISRQGHCQRFLPLQISNMPQVWYEPAQNLSSDFVERSCAAVAGTAPQRHKIIILP